MAQQFNHIVEGLKKANLVGTHTYHLKSYQNCFIAKDAIDWLIQQKIVSKREDGVKLGQEMIEAGVVCHVVDDHSFKDERLFFRFTDNDRKTAKLVQTLSFTAKNKASFRLKFNHFRAHLDDLAFELPVSRLFVSVTLDTGQVFTSTAARVSHDPIWSSEFSCVHQYSTVDSILQSQTVTFRVFGKGKHDEREEVLGLVKIDNHTILTGPSQQNLSISRFVSDTFISQRTRRFTSSYVDNGLPHIVKAAYLYRRGRTLRGWQKRWYVLAELGGVWSWVAYSNSSMVKVVKEMDFEAISSVVPVSLHDRKYCFQLVFGKEKVLDLSCDSEEEQRSWLDVWSAALARLHVEDSSGGGVLVEECVGRLACVVEAEPLMPFEILLQSINCILWHEHFGDRFYLQYAYSGASRSAVRSETSLDLSWKDLEPCLFQCSLRELLNEALLIHVVKNTGEIVATASLAFVKCPLGAAFAKYRFFEPLVVRADGQEVGELVGTLEINHGRMLAQLAGGINTENGISCATPLLAGLSWPRHATGGQAPYPEGRSMRSIGNHFEMRLSDFSLHYSYDTSILTTELLFLLSYYRMMGYCVPEMVSQLMRSGVGKGFVRVTSVLQRPLNIDALVELVQIIQSFAEEMALYVACWKPTDVADDLPNSSVVIFAELRHLFRWEIESAMKDATFSISDRRAMQNLLPLLYEVESKISDQCAHFFGSELKEQHWKVLERLEGLDSKGGWKVLERNMSRPTESGNDVRWMWF